MKLKRLAMVFYVPAFILFIYPLFTFLPSLRIKQEWLVNPDGPNIHTIIYLATAKFWGGAILLLTVGFLVSRYFSKRDVVATESNNEAILSERSNFFRIWFFVLSFTSFYLFFLSKKLALGPDCFFQNNGCGFPALPQVYIFLFFYLPLLIVFCYLFYRIHKKWEYRLVKIIFGILSIVIILYFSYLVLFVVASNQCFQFPFPFQKFENNPIVVPTKTPFYCNCRIDAPSSNYPGGYFVCDSVLGNDWK